HRSCRGIKTYVHDSMLFISTYEGIIDAFDYHSGTLLWSIELRGNMIFELLFHSGNIYCSCDDGRIYCISEKKGDIMWIVNTESEFIIRSAFFPIYMEIHGELLLVGIENGPIFMISIE
ncbi:MAG: PQQ-like beta-propeller repeat protein, partial [Theionarchaea archaeon]|nr:PQQ-like beta-propeller repeat protein [Theionarchaea archaeon]